METPRPLKWRRHERRRTNDVRRLLVAGAVIGVTTGFVAQAFVSSSVHGEIEGIVRLSLLLPGLVFIAWLLLSPGAATDLASGSEPEAVPVELDPLARVEQVFDAAAVPRARRVRVEPLADDADRTSYQATIRRDPNVSGSASAFGVRRPTPGVPETETGS